MIWSIVIGILSSSVAHGVEPRIVFVAVNGNDISSG